VDRKIVLGVALAAAAWLALSGGIYQLGGGAGGAVWRLNKWTGSVEFCRPNGAVVGCTPEGVPLAN
jgi:hypothetical protein